jgi:hypothetical protein
MRRSLFQLSTCLTKFATKLHSSQPIINRRDSTCPKGRHLKLDFQIITSSSLTEWVRRLGLWEDLWCHKLVWVWIRMKIRLSIPKEL